MEQVAQWLSNNIDTILNIVILVVNAIVLIKSIISGIKTKKFTTITTSLETFIESAEQLKTKSGESIDGSIKKEIVLSKVATLCNSLNLTYDESYWSEKLESLISFSKNVNSKAETTPIESTEAESTAIEVDI